MLRLNPDLTCSYCIRNYVEPVVRQNYSVKPIKYTDDIDISDGSIFMTHLPFLNCNSFDGIVCKHPWLKKFVDSANVRKIFPKCNHDRIVIREKNGERIIKVISDEKCSSFTHKISTTKIVLFCIFGPSSPEQKLWKITPEKSPFARKDKHISYLQCPEPDMYIPRSDFIESDGDDRYTCHCGGVYLGRAVYCYRHDVGYDSW